ncbi:MAG: molybdopterin cofactor-binding domain-containing protein, partial [Deferribacterota bacterium]|nr:molybdopterin cofactor-binding domain-containing protein [Deferribacterota bacterium]
MISRREFLKASALVTIYFTIPIKLNSDDLESFSNRFFSLNKNRHIKAWLELLDNGKFLIKTGKVELGQGIKTALTQIAAEELSIDLDDIDIISGITDKTPDEMYTAGSFSIEHSGTAIKYACATLNNILLKKAEEKLSIPKDMLMIKNNFIYVKNTKEKKIPIKDLITKAPEIYQSKISRNLKTKEPHTYKLIGKPVKRLESEKIVTGDKYFIHDICPKDFTHAKIVRPSFYFKDIDEEKYKEITNKLNKNIKVIRDGLFLAVLSNSEEEAKEATEKLRVVFIRKENNYNNRNIYEFLKKTEPVKE